MPEHPRLEVRFYNGSATQRRLQSKDTSVVSARWKSTRYGNYREADFTIAGSLLELTESSSVAGRQPVRENDRCRVYAILPDNTEQLRWSGIVKSVKKSVGQPLNFQIACTGKFSDVAAVPVDGRFISPTPVDISQAFASFVLLEAQTAYPDLSVSIEESNIGVTTQSEDQFNKTVGGALTDLSERFSGRVVFGCDELNNGDITQPLVDRLFLRSVGSATDPTYTFDVPGGFNGAWFELAEGGKDTTRLANILTITGTDPIYPNYLGEAVSGNVGFDRPVFAQSNANNLLSDPSFDEDSVAWDTGITGASIRDPGRTGARALELDDVGEEGFQRVFASLTAGDTLVVGCWHRREVAAHAVTARMRLQFMNGGSTVGSPTDIPLAPDSVYWTEDSLQVRVPVAAVDGFRVTFTWLSGAGEDFGIRIDDTFAYISGVEQSGWELITEGSAVRNTIDWAHSADKTQGRYSVKLDIDSSDSDGNDAYLQPDGGAKFRVTGGAQIEFGCDIRAWDGTTNGKLRLDLRFYKQDGSEVSSSGVLTVKAAGTINNTWRQIRSDPATVPADAALCLVRVTFRGDSQIYLDRMYVRDTAVLPFVNDEREWIDSGPYRIQIRADDDLFVSERFADSIDLYGRRYESLQTDSVADRATAYAFALAYLRTFGLPLHRPILRIQGSPIAFRCGETIRIAGEAGQWLGGTPDPGELSNAYPIAEIEETADSSGKITTTLALEIEPPSMESLIARIFDKRRRATTGGGVASLAGSPVGGSGGVSQSLSLPVSIANGGTAATTASDARTNLGLGSGESDTVALAKLTPAGADGSLTFTNGILTAHVDPT